MFTPAESTTLLTLLGYPFRTLDPASRNYSKIIADSFKSFSESEEGYVRASLEKIQDIDERLNDALDRLAAKKIDDIETNDQEIPKLRAERNRLIREIGQNMDIPVLRKGGNNVGVVV